MALRLLGQLVVLGSKIVYGTVKASVRQAVANAKQNLAAPASEKGLVSASRRGRMNVEEARLILNVPTDATQEMIKKNFEIGFRANSVEHGGSFYLQSKIVRALESVMSHQKLFEGNAPADGYFKLKRSRK